MAIDRFLLTKNGSEVERDMIEGLDNKPKETFVWDDFDFSVNNLRINPNTAKPDYNEIEGEYLFDDSTTETVIVITSYSIHYTKLYDRYP